MPKAAAYARRRRVSAEPSGTRLTRPSDDHRVEQDFTPTSGVGLRQATTRRVRRRQWPNSNTQPAPTPTTARLDGSGTVKGLGAAR